MQFQKYDLMMLKDLQNIFLNLELNQKENKL